MEPNSKGYKEERQGKRMKGESEGGRREWKLIDEIETIKKGERR